MAEVISTNPSTGETRSLGFAESSDDEVLAATRRAANAFDDFANRPLSWRAGLLRAMAEELEGDAANLVELAHAETALPTARLEGELRRSAFQLRFFADVVTDGSFVDATIDHASDSPMGPLPDLRRVRGAIGVVAVFGSSNFPFAFSVPGGDTASALAAGCPVVIKAHPAHPATSVATFAALERGAQRVEAPEGTVNLVFGFNAGTTLVDAPSVSAVGFTGSVGAGLALWERANTRSVPIPFFGELGSANPLVVTASAADERPTEIGTGLAGSMTLGVGQFCTKPGLIFVPRGESGDALVAATIEALSSLGTFTMLSSGIADHFRRGTEAIGRSPACARSFKQTLVVTPTPPRSCTKWTPRASSVATPTPCARSASVRWRSSFATARPANCVTRCSPPSRRSPSASSASRTIVTVGGSWSSARNEVVASSSTAIHGRGCELVDATRRTVAVHDVECRHVGGCGGDRAVVASGDVPIGARRAVATGATRK